MTNTAPVIVLTGAPGVGKSTVARLVTDRLRPGVHLRTDDFYGYIRTGRIEPYLPEAHRQNEVVVGIIADVAFGYAAGGYHVVVDGIVGPWFIEPFRLAAETTGLPLHYVVLRPNEAITLRRAAGRGSDALTDATVISGLHRQFSELGEYEPHAIDTSLLTSDQAADAVLAGVDDGGFLLRKDIRE